MSNQVKDTVYKLLSVIDSETQIRKYLKRFSSDEGLKFAVIKVGGKILKDEMAHLVASLSFLKQVGLTPIVVHGAGPQLNKKLEQQNITTKFVDGQRVTTPKVLKAAREVFIEENHHLTSTLKEAGVDATSFYSGIFNCELLGEEQLGLVGDIVSVEVEQLLKAVAKGRIPVVSPLGETEQGQIVNVNADAATFSLAKAIEPYKIIFLTETGGVLDQHNKIIPNISIVNHYDYLIQQSWVHSGMKLKLEMIKSILQALPSATSVSITKPELLAKELFTDRGSGTLVNMGERALVADSWDEIDTKRFAQLIESSFGKELCADYFNSLPLYKVYVTECYRAAIVLSGSSDKPYLDKFVVSHKAKGEGIGRALWDKVTRKHRQLFWRANVNNPINKFYAAVADGFIKSGQWRVYWNGINSYQDIQQCVEEASIKPETLLPAGGQDVH
ncbi:acetylglutamate kinase [Kangiella sediminilitoris]|uniref:Acetylglutamate kinase n=1 Tax=Kangiella sediminilitoris TaxID=1144748 RepID=A0A1B3BCZ9_9GAMM|nr:acetylglutamate kinase [Kangiella sediminilitoris]AOE50607.1 acetylglutamate kinase [Kangiella sediminilitoris]